MQNNKLLTFCNLYILLWLIYSFQSLFIKEAGTSFSLILVALLIGISFYHFVYVIVKYKMPSYMKGLTALVIMFSIYGIIHIISGEIVRYFGSILKNYNYIKTIYISLLPVYSFYVFTRKGLLNKEMIQKWTIVFFVLAILQYFQERRLHLLGTLGVEEFTNNLSYAFLSFIPLMVFWEHKKIVQYVGLSLSMVFLVSGMKRGAILIGGFAILFFILNSAKKVSKKQKVRVLILGAFLIVGGVYLVSDMLQTSDYFNQRVEDTFEGNSSSRNLLYRLYWNHFINETNVLRFLFGNGANATLNIGWNYAHNDWLEILINQGLIGVIIYLFYWILFYKTWRKSKYDNLLYNVIGLILLVFFMKTLFSMSYTEMRVYDSLPLGYCMGMLSNKDLK